MGYKTSARAFMASHSILTSLEHPKLLRREYWEASKTKLVVPLAKSILRCELKAFSKP
jgi:hypothetical protein